MTSSPGVAPDPCASSPRTRRLPRTRTPVAGRAPRLPSGTDRTALPAARTALVRNLTVTTHILVPLLLRTVPAGCDAAVLPLREGGRAWLRGAGRRLAGSVLDELPPVERGSTPAPAWTDRAVVRLWRFAAWRRARSRRSPIPTLIHPPATVSAGRTAPASTPSVTDPARWSPWVVPAAPAGMALARATAEAVRPVPERPSGRPHRTTPTGPLPPIVVTDRLRRPQPTPSTGGAPRAPFPVDAVYTWVDDRDPVWRRRYADAVRRSDEPGLDDETVGPARYRNRDELRYSLRSLALYAPFVRNVYLVTSGQTPAWLHREVPNLRVVHHEEILGPDCLPTFNSHAIESRLHHIDGLAEHYLYLNDDFFFARGCQASTFFTAEGLPRFFPDQRAMVPDGPPSPADRPVDSASKRTREIMAAEFDFPVTYKMQHVPYPQRRSTLFEMEERFPTAFKTTARNGFRHHTDVNVPSCLSHYYGFVTGAAVPGRISASYINIGNPWAQLRMRRLLQRADRDVFCLNDTPMSSRRRATVDRSVRAFLESYFPVPSPFERCPLSSAQAPETRHVREAVHGR